MDIRAISNKTGFSIDTIRYYEKMGLIENVDRSKTGYRIFTNEDFKRFLFIKKAKNMGFTLKDIKELLTLKIEEDEPCEPVHKMAKEKLQFVEQKLGELEKIRIVLKTLISQCSRHQPTEPCPVLRILEN
ncbi:MAG: MerR family transcriptional regulator [Calditrichaeota bacterium]|nr:MAG: MerR family transcriptional regulator [Calditrichota bacterium]MBL1204392.1 MerR family transcriptional regulator [Calditrichota bacterium]NOG44221.1 MerR family transcriptional regulator [Calditrichota bacterium]